MAHELTITNGKAEMAFVGDRSQIWHGLGQQLTEDSPLEVWQKEAGMDWTIKSSEVKYADPDSGELIYTGKKALYRSDSKAPLSIVSDRYKIVQPHDVLEFFRDLVADNGMKLSTAGTLFGGKKFWALADTGNHLVVNGNDRISGYVLLATSCDGSLATAAQFTSIRVVCNNTLSIAVGEGNKRRVSAHHFTEFDPRGFKEQLGLYQGAWSKFSESIRELSQVKLSDKDSYNFILDFIAEDSADPTAAEVRTVNEIHGMYSGAGMGSISAGKTAYGLLNAFTEYYDHRTGRIASNRLNSSFFGSGNLLKNRVYDQINAKFGVAA